MAKYQGYKWLNAQAIELDHQVKPALAKEIGS